MTYQRGAEQGGLTAEEVQEVLRRLGTHESMAKTDAERSVGQTGEFLDGAFSRGIAAMAAMARDMINDLLPHWHCRANGPEVVCEANATHVDMNGQRWCAEHAPDDQDVTIAEHDDQRAQQ